MVIPDYQSIMHPLLQYTGDKEEHSIREAIEHISEKFGLSNAERKELLPSGRQVVIDNRVGWACTYLKKAGLLFSTRRGYFTITDRGLDVLNEELNKIDKTYLKQFPEFIEFTTSKPIHEENQEPESDLTPVEQLEESHQGLRDELKAELLEQVKTVSPAFFERLVVDLLVVMGYGGNLKDAGSAVGRSGDEGIDGVIKEDKLGLDNLYVQAKRWKNTVGRPVVQSFVGALQGKKARKGVMITTSHFTRDAVDYAAVLDTKVVLIDGAMLVDLMIDYCLGVSVKQTYELKEIDQDYFTEA